MICKLMIGEFMGTITEPVFKNETNFDEHNILYGIDYCDWLTEMKITHEPHFGFNIKDFKEWLIKKLAEITQNKPLQPTICF